MESDTGSGVLLASGEEGEEIAISEVVVVLSGGDQVEFQEARYSKSTLPMQCGFTPNCFSLHMLPPLITIDLL